MERKDQHRIQHESAGRILIVTAVSAEMEAISRGLEGAHPFDFLVGGVGPIASAVHTTKALLTGNYQCVVNAGIAGGFAGQADIGSLVVASEVIAADLGVETKEQFRSLEEMGFGHHRLSVDPYFLSRAMDALRSSKLPVRSGPIITVSTATGTADTASKLVERVPNAVAEAMEGYGVAFAAHAYGVPFLEIRAISNQVGPRDRSLWRIEEALEALTATSLVLAEVFTR